MLTEAEQLSLDRARGDVRSLCEQVLRDLPAEGEDASRGDLTAAVFLGFGGTLVGDYLKLVKAHKEAIIYEMTNGREY